MSGPRPLHPAPLDRSERAAVMAPAINGGFFLVLGAAALLVWSFQDRQTFLLLIGVVLCILGLGCAWLAVSQWQELRRFAGVRHNGDEVDIELLTVEPTAIRMRKQKVMAMRLRVLPRGGKPYELMHRAPVPGLVPETLRPGRRLQGRVHPDEPRFLVLVAPSSTGA